MDARFDEDQPELAVLVLAVALEVLADGHSLSGLPGQHAAERVVLMWSGVMTDLLDEHVQVLRYLRYEACGRSLCQSFQPSRGIFYRIRNAWENVLQAVLAYSQARSDG